MITIINYGVGNLGSIQNMLKKIGAPCKISSDPEEIDKSDKILLPGVGSFDFAMAKLENTPIPEILKQKVAEGVPILGICLGAQLLTMKSEEGMKPGLGLLDAHCVKFAASKIEPLKVPHMGWADVSVQFKNDVMDFAGFSEQPRFYFAHSYHFVADEALVLGISNHGYDYASVLFKDTILAMQFHPEKSHYFGMRLLENFNRWNP